MTTTVKGILENFLIMVDTHGLVPNGGRIYYTKRSQPPFLTLMVRMQDRSLDLTLYTVFVKYWANLKSMARPLL